VRGAAVREPHRVAQRVERVLDRMRAGRDICNHDRACSLAGERVAQHLRELGAAEGRVRLAGAKRADALLEHEQRLVDLGALVARRARRVGRVGRALRAGEVDEREAAVRVARLGEPQRELQHCVRARRVLVGRRGADAAD
jgi:hypothetical protein